MELHLVRSENLMLDGGAMFGVVPKVLWSRQYNADKDNRINISMRSLLVADGERKILFDSGIGDKQDSKFFGFYFLNGGYNLDRSLATLGLDVNDITDVVHTHLHFDHCGGSIRYNEDRSRLFTTFPQARYWVSKTQWELAMNPNKLEGASFLKENIMPMQGNGQLQLFEQEFDLTPNVHIRLFHGHTAGQAIALIRYRRRTLVNIADLMPLAGNISMSWVCGYDTRPLITLEEKADFLRESLAGGYTYYFYHDLEHECCSLKDTPKGIRPDRFFTLKGL
jgi:glyoxylase-like metal-dependent hydrolase (beta-lactamase superfamily II)